MALESPEEALAYCRVPSIANAEIDEQQGMVEQLIDHLCAQLGRRGWLLSDGAITAGEDDKGGYLVTWTGGKAVKLEGA